MAWSSNDNHRLTRKKSCSGPIVPGIAVAPDYFKDTVQPCWIAIGVDCSSGRLTISSTRRRRYSPWTTV